jgi:hypothetical protein
MHLSALALEFLLNEITKCDKHELLTLIPLPQCPYWHQQLPKKSVSEGE